MQYVDLLQLIVSGVLNSKELFNFFDMSEHEQ